MCCRSTKNLVVLKFFQHLKIWTCLAFFSFNLKMFLNWSLGSSSGIDFFILFNLNTLKLTLIYAHSFHIMIKDHEILFYLFYLFLIYRIDLALYRIMLCYTIAISFSKLKSFKWFPISWVNTCAFFMD